MPPCPRPLAGTVGTRELASSKQHAWHTWVQLLALVLLSLWPGKVLGLGFLTISGAPEKPQNPGLPKAAVLLGRGWCVGGDGGAGFYLPIRELGDSPKAAPAPLVLQAPCENPGEQGSHDTRAWEPPGPPFDVGCAASSKSVRTSSCPGQGAAARRPPEVGPPFTLCPALWGPSLAKGHRNL